MTANAALLLAAGRSERMAGHDKTTIPLAGRPLAAHALRTFAGSPDIHAIVIVAAPHNHDALRALADEYGRHKVTAVVLGGDRRQDSVQNGLAALVANGLQPPDLIVIHDAARPLVTTAMIERGLDLAAQHGAAVAAAPLHDTIKLIQSSTPDGSATVQRTIDRSTLRAAQTPQTFVWTLLQRAYEAHAHTGTDTGTVTDDAMLVEALGETVILYDTDTPNPKVTTPTDLAIVEALLQAQDTAAPANH
jgi:2-C-methyl-D-erythritol 4-phosphate cytidylyltransferase